MNTTLRYAFFSVDLLWWFISAFPGVRPEGLPLLELVPVFDIVAFIAHIIFIVFVVVFRGRLAPWVILFLLWTCMLLARHGAFDQSKEQGGEVMRVVTVNVQQLSESDGAEQHLIRFLDSVKADVVALQEFGSEADWPDTRLAVGRIAQAGGFSFSDFAPVPGNVYGTAVFSRFPMMLDTVLFSHLSRFNEAKAYRIELPGKQMVRLVNVHIHSFGARAEQDYSFTGVLKAQLRQANLIAAYAAASDDPIAICGDINAVAGTKVYHLLASGMLDAQKEAGMGWLATHRHFPLRIDHGFFSQQFSVQEVSLAHFPSTDHFALLVDVKLP